MNRYRMGRYLYIIDVLYRIEVLLRINPDASDFLNLGRML